LNLFNADWTGRLSARCLAGSVAEIWRRVFRRTRVTCSEPLVHRAIGRQSDQMVVAKKKGF
jgi:hypothetical protein